MYTGGPGGWRQWAQQHGVVGASEAVHRARLEPPPAPSPFRSRGARFAFGVLRVWARAALWLSSVLSIVSGALSFTVVPAIVLSVLSAGAQVRAGAQASLMRRLGRPHAWWGPRASSLGAASACDHGPTPTLDPSHANHPSV